MWYPPTKPMTPSAWQVLHVTLMILSFALGILCLWLVHRAPPNQADTATTVLHIGYGAFATSGILALAFYLYHRLVD